MGEIAYQNYDITQKLSAEMLKNKSLAVYGRPDIQIKDLKPTNLPGIEANELRLDNLFVLADDTWALVDYESSFTAKDVVKYVNYIARILKRYLTQNDGDFPQIRLLIIFSADIRGIQKKVLDVGCLKMKIDPVFLHGLNSRKIYRKLKCILTEKGKLSDDEILQMIILPLTVEGKKNKKKMLKKTVELAKQIENDEQKVRALAGILTFSDKFIDAEDARRIKEEIRMNKVTKLIFDEGLECGIEQGITRGITQGITLGITQGGQQKVVFLIRKWNKKMNREEIAELLDENREKVERIIFLIEKYPEADDRMICEMMNRDGENKA